MWVSFKENIQNKTTNPFFGTLILVWCAKNWSLLFMVFNFNPNTTLDQKIALVNLHFEANPFIHNLILCVLEALVLIIISYALINLSRLIIEFYDKQVAPWVYKLADNNSIVLKSVHQLVLEQVKILERKVDEERDAKLKIQAEYDKLEKRYSELLEKANTPPSIGVLANRNEAPSMEAPLSAKASRIIEMLGKEGLIEDFKKMGVQITNKYKIDESNQLIMSLTTNGVVSKGNSDGYGMALYSFTTLGQEIHEYLIMNFIEDDL